MTQVDKVRNYLMQHPEGLDPIISTDHLGVYRLSAVIKQLRDEGMRIASFRNGNYALYRMVPLGVDEAQWVREQGQPCYFGVQTQEGADTAAQEQENDEEAER